MLQIVASLTGKSRCIIYNPLNYDVYCTSITYYMTIFIWSVQVTGLLLGGGILYNCLFSKLQCPIHLVNVIVTITLFHYFFIFSLVLNLFFSLKLGFEPGLPQLLWQRKLGSGSFQHQWHLRSVIAIKLISLIYHWNFDKTSYSVFYSKFFRLA